jgi:hypothetical protein
MLQRINGKRRRDLGYDAHEFALQRVHPGAPLKDPLSAARKLDVRDDRRGRRELRLAGKG